jgi:putative membrane protein
MAPPAGTSAPGWNLDPVLLGVAVFVAIAYATRARNLARDDRPVRPARQASFFTGLAILVLALVSPVDQLGEERLFYVHMVQHLTLVDLAPLALVIGVTGPILQPVLRLGAVRRLRALAHPLVALPLWVLAVCFWHLPALYQAALQSAFLHGLEHLSFFAAGLALWAAVIEPLPGPAWFGAGPKAAYVLVVRGVGAVLGNVFIWAGQPVYPDYAEGERLAGVSPLTDQTIGGAIMFTEGAIVTLVVFAWLFLRWSDEAEMRQSLTELGHDRRVAVRAARYRRRALARAPRPPLARQGHGRPRSGPPP